MDALLYDPCLAATQPYGDTVLTFDYIRSHWPEFEIVGSDVNPADEYQIVVHLKAV